MVLHQDLISGLGGVHRGVGVSEGGLDQLGNCRQLCYLVGVTTHGRASLGFFRRLRVSPAAAINWILSRAFDLYTGGLRHRRSSFSGMGAPPLLFSFLLVCFFFSLLCTNNKPPFLPSSNVQQRAPLSNSSLQVFIVNSKLFHPFLSSNSLLHKILTYLFLSFFSSLLP